LLHPGVRPNLIALVLCLAAPLTAVPGQAVPRTLTGVVRDTLGRPLEDAVIVLNPMGAQRAMRADAAGRFRFDRVGAGRYTMRTTWIGYVPDERTIDVPPEGLQVIVTLTPVAFRLDTLTIVARRSGIFGITAYRQDLQALGAVEVSVLGTRHRTRTPSDGKFSFGDVRAGGWVVLAKRDGFETMLLSVAVPDTAAVELLMAMDTIRTKAQAIANNRVMDMQMRVNRMQRNSSAIVPHQELARVGRQNLDMALRYSPSFLIKGLAIRGVECVFINGQPKPSVLAKDIAAEDVAMVEVYNYRGAIEFRDAMLFRSNGQNCGVGRVEETFGTPGRQLRLRRPPPSDVVAFIHIWLK
jgi:carboxypeptidase family protein